MVDVGTVAVNAALAIAWGLALGLYFKHRFDRLFKLLDASQQRWEERQRLWEVCQQPGEENDGAQLSGSPALQPGDPRPRSPMPG
jgi:hypothetical protein